MNRNGIDTTMNHNWKLACLTKQNCIQETSLDNCVMSHLSRLQRLILAKMYIGQTYACTRVQETSTGDSEVLWRGSIPDRMKASFGLPIDMSRHAGELETLQALHELEQKDLLIAVWTVHPFDTCEYIVEWILSDEACRQMAAYLVWHCLVNE